MEITTAGVHVTTEPKRLVNGLYWNLNSLNPCPLAVSTECFGLFRNYSISSMLCDECRDSSMFFENHTEWRICFRSCVALVALWCADKLFFCCRSSLSVSVTVLSVAVFRTTGVMTSHALAQVKKSSALCHTHFLS